MSRGPGKWQRVILERLESGPFYMIDLLPETYTVSQYQALRRALYKLVDDRQLEVTVYLAGLTKIFVRKVGTPPPKREFYHRYHKCIEGDKMSPSILLPVE